MKFLKLLASFATGAAVGGGVTAPEGLGYQLAAGAVTGLLTALFHAAQSPLAQPPAQPPTPPLPPQVTK